MKYLTSVSKFNHWLAEKICRGFLVNGYMYICVVWRNIHVHVSLVSRSNFSVYCGIWFLRLGTQWSNESRYTGAPGAIFVPNGALKDRT